MPMLKQNQLFFTGMLLTAACCVNADTHSVLMTTDDKGMPRFHPDYLLIQPGDIVVWENTDRNVSHNIIANPGGIPKTAELFNSPLLNQHGNKWSYQFSQLGTYSYHCHPHADKGMQGTIVVGRESLLDEIRQVTDNSQRLHHHHMTRH